MCHCKDEWGWRDEVDTPDIRTQGARVDTHLVEQLHRVRIQAGNAMQEV